MAVVLTSRCSMVRKGTNGSGINKSLLYGYSKGTYLVKPNSKSDKQRYDDN